MRIKRSASFLAALGIVAGACGGSASNSSQCPGATRQDGSCAGTSTDGGQGTDALSGDANGQPDVTLTDGPVDAAPSDGSSGEPPSDPCPPSNPLQTPAVFLECDTKCCALNPACAQHDGGVDPGCSGATCAGGPTTLPELGGQPFVVRTPERPGQDPQCATKCPTAGFVYGMGFTFNSNDLYNMFVVVGAPWEIISYSTTPYCTGSTSTVSSGCAFVLAHAGTSIYVVTKDPNAPARNITFLSAGTQTTCPLDAGG